MGKDGQTSALDPAQSKDMADLAADLFEAENKEPRSQVGLLTVALACLMGALLHYWLLSGATPEKTDYLLDITQLRHLASAPTELLPTAIRVESVGHDDVPEYAIHAGGGIAEVGMTRTAFQIETPTGAVVVDSGMDKALFGKYSPDADGRYSGVAYNRILEAMAAAKLVLITHAHPDHIGGVARYPDLASLVDRLVLNPQQAARLAIYAPPGGLDPAFANLHTHNFDGPTAVAPGIVVVPAPGHTPGNQMIFVRLASGVEVLLAGDVVWNMSNVREARGRPRVVQYLVMKPREDREQVYDQVRALHNLALAEPGLYIVPSHDEENIDKLVEAGVLAVQFAPPPEANNNPEPAEPESSQ